MTESRENSAFQHGDDQDQWSALLDAMQAVRVCVEQWAQLRLLRENEAVEVREMVRFRIESWKAASQNHEPFRDLAGFLPVQPKESAHIRGLRAGLLMNRLLESIRDSEVVSSYRYGLLERDADERLNKMRRRLKTGGHDPDQLEAMAFTSACSGTDEFQSILESKPTATSDHVFHEDQDATTDNSQASQAKQSADTSKVVTSRRSLMEIMLDPRSIQCLLGLGGTLITVGLVILLWINNYLTPPVMAIVLATGNVAFLGSGLATIRYSRYQLAGRGLALLACLVMPLNLWYCHSHNLVTIDGHLWLLAVVISMLYGLSAWLVRDRLFVYVFNAGVTLTGLLFLADIPPSPQKFLEIASPASLLVILGLVGIHLVKAFAPEDQLKDKSDAFSRERFGMAFFWSGHVQLAAGLLLVLGAQVAGDWFYNLGFHHVYSSLNAQPSPICGELRWLSLILVGLGIYGWVYSDIAVRRKGVFLHVAAVGLLWMEVLVLQMFNVSLGVDAVIAILATSSLLTHLVHAKFGESARLTRTLPAVGLILGVLPVVTGLFVFFHHFRFDEVWAGGDPRFSFVAAMLFTACTCRVGAHVFRRTSADFTEAYYLAAGAAATIGLTTGLAALGLSTWSQVAPVAMLVPLGCVIASRFYGESIQGQAAWKVAQSAGAIMLAISLMSTVRAFFSSSDVANSHMLMSLLFAEGALFYGLSAGFRKKTWCAGLAAFATCGCIWHLLLALGAGTQTFMLVFAVAGICMLTAYRFAGKERAESSGMFETLLLSANTLLSLAFVSAFFHGMFEIAKGSLGVFLLGEPGRCRLRWLQYRNSTDQPGGKFPFARLVGTTLVCCYHCGPGVGHCVGSAWADRIELLASGRTGGRSGGRCFAGMRTRGLVSRTESTFGCSQHVSVFRIRAGGCASGSGDVDRAF